jgi:hypothetical protein
MSTNTGLWSAFAHAEVAAANVWLGRDKEAKETVVRLQKVIPGFSVQTWAAIHWIDDPPLQRVVVAHRTARGDKATNLIEIRSQCPVGPRAVGGLVEIQSRLPVDLTRSQFGSGTVAMAQVAPRKSTNLGASERLRGLANRDRTENRSFSIQSARYRLFREQYRQTRTRNTNCKLLRVSVSTTLR